MEELVRWFGPCFGLAMVIYWVTKYFRERNDEDLPNSINTKGCLTNVNAEPMNTNDYDGKNIKTMLETALKNCGCKINLCVEKSNEFKVTYQGEHFTVVYSNESPYITIYDIAWYSEDLNDIDNFSMVTKAVNLCNQQNTSTVLYTIDKDNNCVNVHTRQCVAFGSFIPKLEDYLRSRFEDSFQQHHNFYRYMELSRKEQFA